MAKYARISDAHDARLAPYIALRDPILRRATQVPGALGLGVFIAEGKLVLPRVLASRYPIESVLVSPNRLAEFADILNPYNVTVLVCDQHIIDLTTGYHLHRGLLVCASRTPVLEVNDVLENARRIAIIEGLTDQENLGSIFRCARALGIDAILLDPASCDPLYRRVVRVSMGYALHLPWTRLDPWPNSLDTVLAHGFEIVALTPDASARPLREFAAEPHAKLAVVLGAEAHGLTDDALQRAHHHVRIEQRADVDSLNVSHAAAIAFAALATPDRSQSVDSEVRGSTCEGTS